MWRVAQLRGSDQTSFPDGGVYKSLRHNSRHDRILTLRGGYSEIKTGWTQTGLGRGGGGQVKNTHTFHSAYHSGIMAVESSMFQHPVSLVHVHFALRTAGRKKNNCGGDMALLDEWHRTPPP